MRTCNFRKKGHLNITAPYNHTKKDILTEKEKRKTEIDNIK